YNENQILRSYYGNVETVVNAPVLGLRSSYPGTPLRLGSRGPNVVVVQVALNRIAQNYPAIPKLAVTDGIFGPRTEASVRAFQEIFDLTVDGVVGRATWYAIVRLYTAVTRLSELRSLGQQFYAINWNPENALQVGSTGEQVRHLQYMLSVLADFIPGIPNLTVDGIYGNATRSAVLAAQRRFRLPETGIVDRETWDEIYDQYSGIETTALRSRERFPEGQANAVPSANLSARNSPRSSSRPSDNQYNRTGTLTQFPGKDLIMGSRDPVSQEVVR
ncbi:MAG: peptidoglycan-binding protein, partial [Lentisphaeria bacterium]|nr:peptidoglycan-binding protein [Lentisphaeria bacterium]